MSPAATATGLWAELGTDWLLLDGELLPWSAKAEGLLVGQYAPVGASALATTGAAVAAGGTTPAPRVCLLALLYSLGAHGIMTLNDFKASTATAGSAKSYAARTAASASV